MIDLNLANTCDNCDKHLALVHGPGKEPVCDRCLQVTTLLTCSQCHEVRYCSRDCQKTHWRGNHQEACAELSRVVELSQSYGPTVVSQRKNILRWSKKNRRINTIASFFALGVGTKEDKSQSHCFLLTVEARATGSGSLPSITVIDAQIASDEELHARGVAPNSESLRKQSNCVKIIIFDPALPNLLGFVYMFLETVDVHAVRNDVGNAPCNWKAWLMDSISAGGESMLIADYVDYGVVARSRRAVLETWVGQFGESFGKAAYSALELEENAKKMSTHVLRVHVDGIGGASPLFKVRCADIVTFDEVGLQKALKKTIYTLVIDDSLPKWISECPIGLDVHNFKVKGMYPYRHNWLQQLKQTVDQY